MSGTNEIGCTVLIDGQPISDGYVTTDPDAPAVLSGLRVTWGRSTTVDQPQPSTCTFTVLDPLEGDRLVPALTIGRRVDVRTDTVLYPPADETTIDRMYPSTVTGASGFSVAADGKTATMIANGHGRLGFYLPPLPYTSNPLGWDAVPRSLPGQAWRVKLTVTPPAPFAGYADWAAEVAPAYFTQPDGSDVSAPGPFVPCDPSADLTFTPPPGVWIGLAVHLYPVGPAWEQLDGTTWAAAGTESPVPAGIKVTAFGDSITAGTWLSSYSDSWMAKLEARLGVPVTNRAVGGAALHSPGGDPNVIMAQVTAALNTAPTARTNLATNPGYEVGTNSITTAHTGKYPMTADTAAPIAGARSALTARSATSLDSVVSQLYLTMTTGQFPVTAGVPVTSGLSIKSDGSGLRISTQYFWYDASNVRTVATGTIRQSNTVAGTTYRVTETGTPIPGTVTAYFVVSVTTAAGNAVVGQKVWADQLTIETGTTDGSYFDGSTPDTADTDYSWTGTANASTSKAITAAPTFTHAVILAGTNDLMTHDNATLSQSAAAAQAVQDALAAKGVRVIWLGVLPMGKGSSHSDNDLPTLLDRRLTLDNLLRTIAGSRWVPTDYLYGADSSGFVLDTSAWLLDGLHPNPAGATQLANYFPLGIMNPAYTARAHPTWDELATFGISGFELLAPAAGTAASALVFSGRITDVEARWDGGPWADVSVIAQDWLAELANRYVGSTPWAAEALGARAQRIVSLSGQPIQIGIDAGITDLVVTYRDVDRQPAANLLQQLAITAGGVLWTATHLVTGQVMRIEDVNARPAALTLTDQPIPPGLVHVVPSPAAIENAMPMSACVVEADPVRFILDMTDTISMVAVTWLDQVTEDGVIKPAQRTVEVTAPETLALIGARRLSVSTQLTTEADATLQATDWLARSSVVGWRIEGLAWDTTGDLSPDEISSVMTLLDGTRRNGLPIALTELPEWAGPMTHGQSEVALYVEGGRYEYEAGSWVLELMTSSATGSAIGNLPWQNLEPGWSWAEFDPEVAWLDLYGVTYPVI